jgi:hypothetical protein
VTGWAGSSTGVPICICNNSINFIIKSLRTGTIEQRRLKRKRDAEHASSLRNGTQPRLVTGSANNSNGKFNFLAIAGVPGRHGNIINPPQQTTYNISHIGKGASVQIASNNDNKTGSRHSNNRSHSDNGGSHNRSHSDNGGSRSLTPSQRDSAPETGVRDVSESNYLNFILIHLIKFLYLLIVIGD